MTTFYSPDQLNEFLGEVLRSPEEPGIQYDNSTLIRRIELCRIILSATHKQYNAYGWGVAQAMLGMHQCWQADLTADTTLLHQAEASCREALKVFANSSDSSERAKTQIIIANIHFIAGKLTGDVESFEHSAAASRDAIREFRQSHSQPEGPDAHNMLGNALAKLGSIRGEVRLLERAEAAYREALSQCTYERSPMKWAIAHNNLGNTLALIGKFRADVGTLRQAVATYGIALEKIASAQYPLERALLQHGLGNVLLDIGQSLMDADILRESAQACLEALKWRTRDRAPMSWAMTQHNLGNALSILGILSKDTALIERAVQAYRAALEVRNQEESSPDRVQSLHGLAGALHHLAMFRNDMKSFRVAEDVYSDTLRSISRESSPIAWCLAQKELGHMLHQRGLVERDASVLDAAERAFRQALSVLDTSDDHKNRQTTAASLSDLLVHRGRYDDAMSIIVPALERSDAAIVDAARSREGRLEAVARVEDLHSLLSLCLLRRARPDLLAALEAIEAGRARLLKDALALDETLLDELPQAARRDVSSLREQRDSLRVRLGYLDIGSTQNSAEAEIGPKRRLPLRNKPLRNRDGDEAELRAVSDRYLSACRRHGLVSTPAKLHSGEIVVAAPANGALVIIGVTDSQAFALVISNGKVFGNVLYSNELGGFALNGRLFGADGWLDYRSRTAGIVSTKAVSRRSRGFDRNENNGILSWIGGIAGDARRRAKQVALPMPPGEDERKPWNTQIRLMQRWLWDTLLGRVDGCLRHTLKLSKGAPVVLLPAGRLAALPLASAGPDEHGEYFCDHWTVSLIPSVRSLLESRARLSRPPQDTLLAAIDPRTGPRPDGTSLPSLAGARLEATMLSQRFAHAQQHIFVDADARLENVSRLLPEASYFHASTHGLHDGFAPERSALPLADGTELRLDMLQHIKLNNLRLAYLSACDTGLAGIRRAPDEFIGLPLGFLQAGAAGVIATLWPVFDDTAFLIADRFYDYHMGQSGLPPMEPAVALRAAQAWLRSVTRRELKKRYQAQEDDKGNLFLETTIKYGDTLSGPPMTLVRLPLGVDGERPFENPQDWAAYTFSGA